jgi:hypothetical protein
VSVEEGRLDVKNLKPAARASGCPANPPAQKDRRTPTIIATASNKQHYGSLCLF